jgi:chromate transporter
MIYLELFWSFLQIGLFSIGGGYAALPLIQKQIVDLHHWLTMTEFIDVVTISQMTPGPIALNAATFVGMRLAGIGGSVVATLGCVTPSCVIVLILAVLYRKHSKLWAVQGILQGLRPAAVGLIAAAGLSLLVISLFNAQSSAWQAIQLPNLDLIALALFGASLVILRIFKTDPILTMLGSGLVGMVLYKIFG